MITFARIRNCLASVYAATGRTGQNQVYKISQDLPIRDITTKSATKIEIMKKVFMMATAVATMLVVISCGNKQTPSANAEADSTSTELTDSTVSATAADAESTANLDALIASKDAKGLQNSITAIQEHYAQLVKEGKLEEAKAYAEKMKEYLNSHADEIKNIASGNTTITDLVNYVSKLPTDAETTAEEAKKYIENIPASVASAATSAAKSAANKAVDDAKSTANQAVTEAKKNAEEKATKAVTDAKSKANQAVENANKKATDAVNKAAEKLLLK